MIEARPAALSGGLVRALLARHLRRGLSALRVVGAERLARAVAAGPVVAAANHVCFWDGFVIAWLSRGFAARVAMRADQLRRAPLLARAGAMGFEPGDPADGARLLRAAARFLSGSGRVFWMFPQGEQRPQWELPLRLQRGAGALSRISGAALVPVSLHYELGEREQPECWVHVGEPCEPEALAARLADGLVALRGHVLDGTQVTSALPPRQRLGEGLFSRLLARVVRP